MAPEPGRDCRGQRLESWKEIAAYLRRDVRTVQRWEHSEGLPVRRLQHSRSGSLYAYAEELDEWRSRRQAGPAIGTAPSPAIAPRLSPLPRLAAAAALGLIALVWWTWPAAHQGVPAAAPIRSLAVLPLVDFSAGLDQQYFADGMTEAVIARLSTLPALFVISRTSVMEYRGRVVSIPEIAKTLNVEGIIEGSVTRSGDRVRITAKLIRGATGVALWSETFDRELHDVLALQSDIAQAVARHVQATLSHEARARLSVRQPVAPDVFENYLKGRFLLHKDTRATSEEAIGLFEAVIAKDPDFAPAYAALAQTYNSLGTYFLGGRPPSETRAKALATARRAIELDPDLPDAYTQRAYVDQREWRWAEAEAGYRRALRLNPNDALAFNALADLLACVGRFDEAVAVARRARETDPLSRPGGLVLAMVLDFARRHDEAIDELRNLLAQDPDDPRALWYLGNALIGSSRFDEAVDVLERSVALAGNPGPMGSLAHAYARAGRRADAQRIVDELTRRAQQTYVPPAAFVVAYAGMGNADAAFLALERAFAERSNLVRSLKVLPVLDPLRGDSRFPPLLRRANLAEAASTSRSAAPE